MFIITSVVTPAIRLYATREFDCGSVAIKRHINKRCPAKAVNREMLPTKLRLFTKPDCPLCDKAKSDLEEITKESSIEVEEIDITTNMGLFTKYKNLIPVLEMDGKRLFVHEIRASVLKRRLAWRAFKQWIGGH